jgi:general secretion pathway protein F
MTPLPTAIRAELFLYLATMERAGLPTDKAFSNLRLANPAQQRVNATIEQLQRGKDIPSAGAATGLFDAFETSLLRAAISAGSPSLTYKRLADRYALKAKLQKKVRSQLMLPSFMLILSLVLSVIPSLISGNISIAAAIWRVAMPLFFIASIYIFAKYFYTNMSKTYDALILQTPYFGQLYRRINLRDYFESLALMLEAGIPMLDALPKANKNIHSHQIRAQFSPIFTQVNNGKTLSLALQNHINDQHFEEASVINIINTGEASGTLPEMLTRYTNQESQGISQSLEQVASWLPRVIYAMVAIWVIIGILSSGAFMPKA